LTVKWDFGVRKRGPSLSPLLPAHGAGLYSEIPEIRFGQLTFSLAPHSFWSFFFLFFSFFFEKISKLNSCINAIAFHLCGMMDERFFPSNPNLVSAGFRGGSKFLPVVFKTSVDYFRGCFLFRWWVWIEGEI
jgi:hypothetical protein